MVRLVLDNQRCYMHRKIEKAIEKIKNVEGFKKVAFVSLYDSVVEEQMTKKLKAMKRFKNIVVHRHNRIDD